MRSSREQQLYFVSCNTHKITEYGLIFRTNHKINLLPATEKVGEIQSLNTEEIVHDKITKAYAVLHRPLIAEHSCLSVDALYGVTCGLAKPYWDLLHNRICDMARTLGNNRATMTITFGFCDGKRRYTRKSETPGCIALAPASGPFHLDNVFIPDGESDCVANLPPDWQLHHSPRAKAAHLIFSSHLHEYKWL